ncbi:MAG: putative esterase [Bacteroidia bacterium]|nr:putative esterase [Bacteroidia bacterium]
MAIWFGDYKLENIKSLEAGTMMEFLEMETTELGADYLRGRLKMSPKVKQPAGLLHGGASVVLAESLGSIGANLVVDPSKFYCVGLDINANHLRVVREGYVYGEARPLHIGKTTQVWEIKLTDEAGKLVCISRLTMAVIAK